MADVDYLGALGVGSGIDTQKVVSALVAAERAPQQSSLDRLKEKSDARLSAFGIVKSTLESVRTQFRKLNDVSDLKSFTTSSSSSTSVSGSATSAAQAGVYSVTATALAERDSFSFTGFASSTGSLNSGNTLTVSVVKGGVTTNLSIPSPTVTNIAETINDSNLGLTANVIDTGQASNRYVLSVSSETGASNAFTISSSVLAGSTKQTTAADAALQVNGIDILSSSNTISSAVAGLTIDLKATFSNQKITVSNDTSQIKTEIKNLITSYNDAKAIFKSLSSSGTSADDPLVGSMASDSVFRSIETAFRRQFTTVSSTPSGNINYWADLGVSMQRDGTLSLKEDLLDTALASSLSDVITAITADTEDQTDIGDANRGLAGDMSATIQTLVKANGSIANAMTNAQAGLSQYETKLIALDARMERIEQRYLQQFASMQQIVDSMNSTSEFLKNNLEAMQNSD